MLRTCPETTYFLTSPLFSFFQQIWLSLLSFMPVFNLSAYREVNSFIDTNPNLFNLKTQRDY